MNIDEYAKFYHVDISTQIDNNWENDTALGIVKDSRKYSIKIRGRDKEVIKKRFISRDGSDSSKTHNRKVIALVYSYLLYKALIDFPEANPLLLCRDVRPEKLVMNYFQKIAAFFKRYDIFNRKIKFRKRTEFNVKEKLPKSLAGKYVRKVYQGKLPATKIIGNQETEELINLISKIL